VPTRILLTSIVTNVALTLLKCVGGVLTGSAGLVADGFHSLTDVISMTVNYLGIKASSRPADGLQAYNNYRKEIIGALAVAVGLFFVGLLILVRSCLKLAVGVSHSPGLGAVLIVVVSYIITHGLYSYSKKESDQSDSPGLAVNTEQIRLNVLSTVAVLIGIAGSCFGMNRLDAVAALFVSLIIIYSSADIVRRITQESEKARLNKKQVDRIQSAVAEAGSAARISRIKTMMVRGKTWLFLELLAPLRGSLDADGMTQLKHNMLSNLPHLDNVIIGATPPRKAKSMRVEIEDFGRELEAARNGLVVILGVAIILVASASALGVRLFPREYSVLLPADEANAEAWVSPLLGRARYFYIYRTDSDQGRFVSNPLFGAGSDIDHQAARLFQKYCVEAVVARNVGPYMFESLRSAGVAIYQAEPNPTIRREIEQFEHGRLRRLTRPNVGVRFGLRNLKLLSPWYNWQEK